MNRNRRAAIPDQAMCLDLMARYEMPPHVKKHSQTVTTVALYLTRRLNQGGAGLDPDLVRAAGLLHDITKRHSFNRPLDHALTGAKLLRKLGYPEVAEVVRQHVRLSASRPQDLLAEAEIVNYADKRVVNDRVVSLDDRIAYIKERYAPTAEAGKWLERAMSRFYGLEKKIFSLLPEGPDHLLQLELDLDRLEVKGTVSAQPRGGVLP
jgi:putative nucleotidyltransferase with HDIG domain